MVQQSRACYLPPLQNGNNTRPTNIQGESGGEVSVWDVIVPVIVRKIFPTNMCLILNGYLETAII